MHQELSLCGNLTVAENFFLEFPEAATLSPGWRSVYKARARAALDAVFPDNAIEVDRALSELPIGERQMVEIARAAATPGVKLIILDEPTSSLGPQRSQQLRSYIHARAAKGVAFIFISHKLFEIVDVANRIAVLRNGKLVWRGATDEVRVPDLVRMMGGEATAVAGDAARRFRFHRGPGSRSHRRRRRRRPRPPHRPARGRNRRLRRTRRQRAEGTAASDLRREGRQLRQG